MLFALLYIFRAREWPNYFTIASFELGNLTHQLLGNDKPINITEAFINNEKLLKSSQTDLESSPLSSLGNFSNVLLVNPSFEETYEEQGYQKMREDGSLFSHISIATRLLPKDSNENPSD
mmetsp:Transcript_19415/g.21717  ORF Transcript_19415/g.21717 Transcript_19415/m.21717 type:complete len:120 (-) Transcript_19415:30-389(-)